MSSYITAQHYQPQVTFVQQPETYTPQMFDDFPNVIIPVSDAIINNIHKIEEKVIEMLHRLEKMGKIYVDSPKLVEKRTVREVDRNDEKDSQLRELFSSKVNQLLNTPTYISAIGKRDNLSVVVETMNDKREDSNKSQLVQPAKSVSKMFDNSSDRVQVDKALLSSFIVLSAVICGKDLEINSQQLVKYDMLMVSKLHENEYGRFW